MRLVWNVKRIAPDCIDRAMQLISGSGVTKFEKVGTTSREEAYLAGKNSGGIDLLVIAGGDGSIHHVVNGVMSLPKQERPSIGILPLGSGNDFARGLYRKRISLSSAVGRIVSGESKPIDLLKFKFEEEESRFAVNQIGIGFSPIVLNKLEHMPLMKGIGALKYSLASAQVLLAKPLSFNLELHGEVLNRQDIFSMINIANGPFEGGGFRTAPKAELADGFMDITMIGAASRLRLALIFLRLLFDFPINASLFYSCRDRHIKISSTEGLSVQVDGELLHLKSKLTKHLEVSLERGAIKVIH